MWAEPGHSGRRRDLRQAHQPHHHQKNLSLWRQDDENLSLCRHTDENRSLFRHDDDYPSFCRQDDKKPSLSRGDENLNCVDRLSVPNSTEDTNIFLSGQIESFLSFRENISFNNRIFSLFNILNIAF